jgi:hypothetical protein
MRVLADFKESSFAQEQSIVLDWDAHAAQYAAGRQHFYGVGGYGKHTCFQFRKLNYVYATQAMHDMTPSCVSALEARFLLWKWCKLPPPTERRMGYRVSAHSPVKCVPMTINRPSMMMMMMILRFVQNSSTHPAKTPQTIIHSLHREQFEMGTSQVRAACHGSNADTFGSPVSIMGSLHD